MANVKVEDGESIESALRRFKKEVIKAGIITEVKRREYHENFRARKKRKKEEGRQKAAYLKRRNKRSSN